MSSLIQNKVPYCGNLILSLNKGDISESPSTAYHPLFAAVDLSSIISTVTYRHSQWSWETSVDPVTATDYVFKYSFINGKWARESSVDQFKLSTNQLPSPSMRLSMQSVPTTSSSTQVSYPITESKQASTIEKKTSTDSIKEDAKPSATVSIETYFTAPKESLHRATDSTTKESLHRATDSTTKESLHCATDSTTKESLHRDTGSKTIIVSNEEKHEEIKSCPSKKLSGCQKRKKNKAKTNTGSDSGKEAQKSSLSSEKKTKLILGVVRISSRTNKAPPPIRVANKGNSTRKNN